MSFLLQYDDLDNNRIHLLAHSDITPNGTIPLEMSKLEVLLSSKKTIWFPLSDHLPRLFKHILERMD